ncbi:MAG: hypothetical protein JXN62_11270 [Bacteroidales bacterium]|nr:hypothetical protein [Bacteroidales bacterium]
MKIFEVLPQGFFSPLSSLNKDHYAACLLLYYDLFTDSQSGVERSRVVSAFESYFHDNTEHVDSEEEEGEGEGEGEDEREGLKLIPEPGPEYSFGDSFPAAGYPMRCLKTLPSMSICVPGLSLILKPLR